MESAKPDDLLETHSDPFKSRCALLVSLLAMVLALASLGGSNASKEATMHNILASNGIKLTGGIALQAFIMTAGVALTCLILYRSGAVRITQRGASILWACVLGIGVTYLISFVLSLFGVATPFISLPNQTGGSTSAYIGLAINGLILVVAAFTFIADIQQVDQASKEGAPASSEWYLAYGLTVSLVWIYFESMKIIFRLAMIFGGKRD